MITGVLAKTQQPIRLVRLSDVATVHQFTFTSFNAAYVGKCVVKPRKNEKFYDKISCNSVRLMVMMKIIELNNTFTTSIL